jgi:hypothetical protein
MWLDWPGIPGYHQPIGQPELPFASLLLAITEAYLLMGENGRYDLPIERTSFWEKNMVFFSRLRIPKRHGEVYPTMWPRLIIGGFLTAVGISLLISVCITPIAPKCAKFYGGLALVIMVPSFIFFFQGLKELSKRVRRWRKQ